MLQNILNRLLGKSNELKEVTFCEECGSVCTKQCHVADLVEQSRALNPYRQFLF